MVSREDDFWQSDAMLFFASASISGGYVVKRFSHFVLSWMALVMLSCQAHAETPYFPAGVWGDAPGAWAEVQRTVFFERWLGGQLAAMKERPLWLERQSGDPDMVVRPLFLPTFDHGTMLCVTIRDTGHMTYVFKALDGAGGYEPGQLRDRTSGQIDQKTAADIQNLLDTMGALDGKTPSQVFDSTVICTDGTTIVLEFSAGEKYSAITRHDCDMDRNDPIRQMIDLFDAASGGRVVASGVGWGRE
jgi:hypothetical protein